MTTRAVRSLVSCSHLGDGCARSFSREAVEPGRGLAVPCAGGTLVYLGLSEVGCSLTFHLPEFTCSVCVHPWTTKQCGLFRESQLPSGVLVIRPGSGR